MDEGITLPKRQHNPYCH